MSDILFTILTKLSGLLSFVISLGNKLSVRLLALFWLSFYSKTRYAESSFFTNSSANIILASLLMFAIPLACTFNMSSGIDIGVIAYAIETLLANNIPSMQQIESL